MGTEGKVLPMNGRNARLQTNEERTKYILMTREIKEPRNIELARQQCFEETSQFKYLGRTIISENKTVKEIKTIVAAKNISYLLWARENISVKKHFTKR